MPSGSEMRRGEFKPLSNTSLLSFCDQSVGDYFCDLDTADFNGDRISDLLSFPRIWAGAGQGAFVEAAPIHSAGKDGWVAHLIVDVNGDGKPDIIAGDRSHRFALFVNRIDP